MERLATILYQSIIASSAITPLTAGSILTRGFPVQSLHGRAMGVINRARLDGTAVVLVASGKGGCGKTTLLLNTAVGYARARRRC